MKRALWGFLLSLAPLLILAGCGVQADQAAKSERRQIAVEVNPVTVADLVESIDIVGALDAKFASQVKSEYPGIVTEVYINEWVKVKKGDPLARLDTREVDSMQSKARAGVEMARAGLLQANVNADRANREYDRALKLKEFGLITQQGLDEAASARAAATSGVAAAKAQVDAAEEDLQRAGTLLSKAVIKAPIDGIVSFRGINVGDLAGDMSAPNPLFRIIDTSVLNLTVTAPSSRMSELKTGQPLTFTTDAIPGKTFSGTVMFINPSVDEVSRGVKVIAEVKNDSGELRASLFARGKIITGSRAGIKQIPRQALQSWDTELKKATVFVVNESLAKRREVVTGVITDDLVEIVSGLETGEKVITRGGFNVRDGDQVKIQETKGA